MAQQIPWIKLGRYISGECTPQEEKEIQTWIKADPERADLVKNLENIWNKPDNNQDWDIDHAWEKISGKLKEVKKSQLRLVEPPIERELLKIDKSGFQRWAFGARVAGFLAVVALIMTGFFLYYPQDEQPANESLTMQEVVAKKGQRSQFKLNDGTRVWLNADSRLQIPARFISGQREVYLEGEAFFKVTPDANRPFIVHAGQSITKVLGTRFNIRAYPGEKEVQVVVEEGKVAFGNSEEPIDRAPKLIQNQMGVLAANHQTVISEIKSLDPYISWIRGELNFKDTPLPEVIRRLERWYDIDCIIDDSVLKNRTVTGSFKNESMTEALKIISLSVGMTYEKNKRNVRFLSKENLK